MILTQKLCFLIYAIFEIRKRYKCNVYIYFTDLFKIIIYFSKNLFLFTLNIITSYVNNGCKINASSQKSHFPSRGSFIIIELQIARNICWYVNIHGQSPESCFAMSDEISLWYIDKYIKTNSSSMIYANIRCQRKEIKPWVILSWW